MDTQSVVLMMFLTILVIVGLGAINWQLADILEELRAGRKEGELRR